MSDAGKPNYVPDRMYARLFQPWTLPIDEWTHCHEDWARVDAIARLPWKGRLLDFGAGDGTLAAMVCSRNPLVNRVQCIEQDQRQIVKAQTLWAQWPIHISDMPLSLEQRSYDGALCCEVLEHLTEEGGHMTLQAIHKVLKPGSMLCVTVPYEKGSRAEYPGHIRKFSWASLGAMLREAGFAPSESRTTDIKGIWLMAIAHA